MKPMTDSERYDILAAHQGGFSDAFFVGVTSTGIFCRIGCPARLPKRENCEFYDSAAEALSAGFRACKRCHPASHAGEASATIKKLIALIESDTERRWNESDIKALAIDPGYESASGFRSAFSKTFGAAPAKANTPPLFIEWLSTPLGPMFAVCDEAHLYMLEFTTRKNMDRGFEKLRKVHKRAVIPGRTEITDQIEMELKAYFDGTLTDFKTPLAPTGTNFQNQVWKALQDIPYGESCAYTDLAIAVGNEKAVRAVASSNANNGLALIIPCHRVIAKGGGLGGYAGGLDKKQWLLDHEKSHKP